MPSSELDSLWDTAKCLNFDYSCIYKCQKYTTTYVFLFKTYTILLLIRLKNTLSKIRLTNSAKIQTGSRLL